jgi:hypothetical protein
VEPDAGVAGAPVDEPADVGVEDTAEEFARLLVVLSHVLVAKSALLIAPEDAEGDSESVEVVGVDLSVEIVIEADIVGRGVVGQAPSNPPGPVPPVIVAGTVRSSIWKIGSSRNAGRFLATRAWD